MMRVTFLIAIICGLLVACAHASPGLQPVMPARQTAPGRTRTGAVAPDAARAMAGSGVDSYITPAAIHTGHSDDLPDPINNVNTAADAPTADSPTATEPASAAVSSTTATVSASVADATAEPAAAVAAVNSTPAAAPVTAPDAEADCSVAVSSDAAVQPNHGPAMCCIPPTLPESKPLGVPVPALPSGKKPNFIVILTDDQGWDDIGLHHPRKPGSAADFIKTPNFDRFLETSLKFDNFYVAPMCSQSRASLLTGRDYARTGTMLVNGGYDYMNRGEQSAGHIMAADGYKSVHYGKWHNGRTLGYEPWHFGFEDSWFPELYINLDNLMRHNGHYVQTEGLMEQDLMDKMLGWLDQQATNNSQPFFLYYAPNAIHQGFLRPGQGPLWQRPAPEPYLKKYIHMLDEGIAQSTIEVWAMLEYMDDVLGRLFDYLENSPLKNDTYIFMMGDNGSELFEGEILTPGNLQKRMPSGMQKYKRAIEEGGIRNFLSVKGPGVQAGVVDSTLLDITDVLPTMADLANVSAGAAGHLPFSGKSFKNLLLTDSEGPTSPIRGTKYASPDQTDRFLFSLSPVCWDPDTVPALDANRTVIKPQPLFDYDSGGINNKLYDYFYDDANKTVGFERCIGVRHKDYKWIGRTGKVYRLQNGSHIELPCNEVTGEEGKQLATIMSSAARQWWNDLVAEPHSFQKPTFYLGFEGWTVTNMMPDAAYDRTPERVRLLPNGATGFVQEGDRMCFSTEVVTSGTYEVVLMYTSRALATFKMAVGPLAQVENDTAPAVVAQLPPLSTMAGQTMGSFELPSSGGKAVDTCLILLNNTAPGTPVFLNLGDIRLILTSQEPPAPPPELTSADSTSGTINIADIITAADSDGDVDTAEFTSQDSNDSDDDDDDVDDDMDALDQLDIHDDSTASVTAEAPGRDQHEQQQQSITDDDDVVDDDDAVVDFNIFSIGWIASGLPAIAPSWWLGGHSAAPVSTRNAVKPAQQRRTQHLGAAPQHTASAVTARIQKPNTQQPKAPSQLSATAAAQTRSVQKPLQAASAPGQQRNIPQNRRAGAGSAQNHNMQFRGIPAQLSAAAAPGLHHNVQRSGTAAKPTTTAAAARNRNAQQAQRQINRNAAQPAANRDNVNNQNSRNTRVGGHFPIATPARGVDPRQLARVRPAAVDAASTRQQSSGQIRSGHQQHSGRPGQQNPRAHKPSQQNLTPMRSGQQNLGPVRPGQQNLGQYRTRQPASRISPANRQRTEIRRQYLKPTPAMRQVEMNALAAAQRTRRERSVATAAIDTTGPAVWKSMRLSHNWPDGQARLESMYSPYAAEAIATCALCQPKL